MAVCRTAVLRDSCTIPIFTDAEHKFAECGKRGPETAQITQVRSGSAET